MITKGRIGFLFFFMLLCTGGLVCAQSVGDYLSNGNSSGVAWETAANWLRYNGTAYVTAPSAPTSSDGVIVIQSGHRMNMTVARTIDQLVINSGGLVYMDMVILTSPKTYTLNDGAGTDIQVNGTLVITSSSTLTGSGTVQVNSGGTLNLVNQAVLAVATTSNGTINCNGSANIQGVTLINNGTFIISDGNLNINSGAGFANNGLFTITNGFLVTVTISTAAGAGNFVNLSSGVIYKTNNAAFSPAIFSPTFFTNSGVIKGVGEYQFSTIPSPNNGSLQPGNGSSGSFTIPSNFITGKNPTFNLDISTAGTVAGTDYDQVAFANTGANVSGSSLILTDLSGSTANTTYTLLKSTTGTFTGPFAAVTIPPNFTSPVISSTTITVTRMIERHWIATTAQNWSNTAFWSATANGTGGASVPDNVTAVYFDAAKNGNCTLTTSTVAGSIIVDAGYTGTITQGANTLSVANTVVMSGGTFAGGSASISVGGNLTFSGTAFTSTSGTLAIGGNLTASSTFNTGSGTINFNGASLQSISGSQVIDFNNVVISNNSTSGVSIQSNQNLKGILSLTTNSIFDADGPADNAIFTLKSTADSPVQDAAIAAVPSGAQISGNVTVERFMSLEGVNSSLYRYIASPVASATVADLQNEILITGTFTGAGTCSGCGTNPSLFYYSEPVITDNNGDGLSNIDDGYIKFPTASNTETFVTGRGYALYVRGDLVTTARWNLRGQINQGNVTPLSFPVTYTSSGVASNDGWNLVGNPYPCTIDWNASSGWTKTNLNGSIYIRDNGGPSPVYATWNGTTGTNGGTKYIAQGQGFWVKAIGSPALQASENVKVISQPTSFFREGTLLNLLRISLKQGLLSDEAVIHFRSDATPGFDQYTDAFKLQNQSFDLSTISANGDRLAINSWSPIQGKLTIMMDIQKTEQGNYSLEFSNIDSFEDVSLQMVDYFLGDTLSISKDEIYNFSVTTDALSKRADRFTLLFNPRVSVITEVKSSFENVLIYPNPSKGIFVIKVSNSFTIESAEIFSIAGIKVKEVPFSKTENGYEALLQMEGQPSGMYLIRINSKQGVTMLKIIKE